MPLSRELTPGIATLQQFPLLIAGPPGIGKSTFLASMHEAGEKVFFIDSDVSESLISYSLPKERVTDWKSLIAIVKEFLVDDYYQYLAVDTLNGAYDLIYRQVCQEKSIDSPSDLNDFGATWSLITKRFMAPWQKIETAGKGLICTCHSTITEVFIGTKKYNRWIPSFTGSSVNSAYAKVEQFFKIVAFMQKENITAPATKLTQSKKGGVKEQLDIRRDASDIIDARLLYLQPTENWVAKDRSGRLPTQVIMPDDWKEDWAVFRNAFNHETETETETEEN
jgi:hypothetical protein